MGNELGSRIRTAVVFLHFPLVLHTDTDSKVAVPNPRACSGHLSNYQRHLELHARVTVGFSADDWRAPHSRSQEDHVVLALLREPEPPKRQTLQPGRASATR